MTPHTMTRQERLQRERVLSRRRLKWLEGHIDDVDLATARDVPEHIQESVVYLQDATRLSTASGVLSRVRPQRAPSSSSHRTSCLYFHADVTRSTHVVITCAHVIPTHNVAKTTQVFSFNHPHRERVGVLAPQILLYVDTCRDIAMCALNTDRRLRHWMIPRAPRFYPSRATVIHHPSDNQMIVTEGRLEDDSTEESDHQCVLHTADTLPGSSGAPIFVRSRSGTWYLYAIHIGARVRRNYGCRVAYLTKLLRTHRLQFVPVHHGTKAFGHGDQ